MECELRKIIASHLVPDNSFRWCFRQEESERDVLCTPQRQFLDGDRGAEPAEVSQSTDHLNSHRRFLACFASAPPNECSGALDKRLHWGEVQNETPATRAIGALERRFSELSGCPSAK